MTPPKTPKGRKAKASLTLGFSKAQLDELVAEATVDAHDEGEQATGFYTMMENDLELPFETEVLGVPVTVEAIDFVGDNRLCAVCRRGTKRQRISLKDLPLPSPLPQGAEWIAAYRHWLVWED
ncbi:MAG TPA: calcium-binding protein [Bryobacteraceae bacterium]|nr:calcium-binding protein [Bryobacteraceae bacterium]